MYAWIQKASDKKIDDLDYARCYAYYIWYSCIVLQTIAQCWADPRSESDKASGKRSSELDSSFMNRLTLWWFTPLPVLGARKDLEVKDLFDLNEGNTSGYLVPIWEKYWIPTIEQYYERKRQLLAQIKKSHVQNGKHANGNGVFHEKEVEATQQLSPEEQLKKLKPPSVVYNLFKMFKYELFTAFLIKAVADVIQFANPFLLNELINFVSQEHAPLWKGIAYAIGMFAASELRSFMVNYYFYIMFRMGVKIQTTLTAAVYKKTLKLSNNARKERTVGEIVNIMAIDIERFQMITSQIQQYWSAPFQCTLALIYLFYTLGYSAAPGVFVMSLFLPLNIWVSMWVRGWQIKQMKLKDERAKMCNELLNGIKVVKLYAWEIPMKEMIEKIRKQELMCILKSSLVRMSVDLFNWSSPFLVGFFSFLTYTLTDQKNHILTPQIAFVSLTLFSMLRSPMTMIGMLIQQTVQAVVSNKRMKEFLVAEEVDENAIDRTPNSAGAQYPIEAKNANFSWDVSHDVADGEEDLGVGSLRDINFEAPRQNLIAVVGRVGSGKSSLLSALLGEMEKLRGYVGVRGNLAYVPQQPWIQNLTLKENILFGRPFQKTFYDKVIDACALRPDLAILPQGDMTEIGEKGINLSGGQKARVSLARAVYQNYDVYLLDDPLSAVDSHVGKHIFDKVIGPNGMLRNKTRLLVTHGITFLKHSDMVVHIDAGKIVEIGTYQELMKSEGRFAKLIEDAKHEKQEKKRRESEHPAEIDAVSTDSSEATEKLELEDETNDYDDSTISVSEFVDFEGPSALMRQMSTVSTLARKRSMKRSSSRKSSIRPTSMSPPKELGKEDLQKPSDEKKLIQKEKVETGRVKMGVYQQYAQAATYFWSSIFVFAYVVYAGLQLARSVWLSDWADDNDKTKHITHKMGVGERLSIYAAYGFGESLFLGFSMVGMIFGALRASRNLHGPVLLNILRSPMSFFDTTPVGRILNRFGKDIDVVDTLIPMNFRYFIMCIVNMTSTLIMIIIATPIFAAVVIPLAFIYMFSLRYYVPTSRQLKRLEGISRSPIYSHFGETIQGASSIRAFGRTEDFVNKLNEKVDHFVRVKYLNLISNRWLAVRLEFVGNCVVLFAALFGALCHQWGWISSAGLIGLSVSYALTITEVLNFAVRQVSELETNIVSVERLKEYAETEVEAPWRVPGKDVPKGWPQRGQVQLAQYATRYRSGLELVIKNISADIKPGEKIGIVGRTGAAAEGKIVIDDVVISEIGLHDLRSNLTIIPQDPVLFSGSLRFNLDPFNRYTDDEIWLALELAHLKSFASSLANGLSHVISEGGDNISVGQRQLVCLARALLRRSKILILDEATAAVDLATDALIQETIRKEFKHSTVLTIAHRLNTILDYDRVLVLDKGEIIEFDSPQNLLADKTSIFAAMAADAKLDSANQ
uniref:Multidrug resistance-associated protein 1 n=1 Tax=Acrobeloides nanus TaxID=290746 RepID=A0A914CDE4_9BILA